MRLHVRPEAELDIYEAALWYDGESLGLGGDFLEKIRRTLRRIEESPLQFPVVSSDIRRAILQKFPFGIFFVLEDQRPIVVAVMHLHRHSSTWEGRR